VKIAYLANVRIPSERAHSTQIIHTCQAFVERGLDVDLYTNKRTIGTNDDIDKQYKIKSLFHLRRLSHGIFVHQIKLTFYMSELIFSVHFLFGLKGRSYDIIFSRSEWIIWILSFFISTNKLVWESHEAKFTLPARQLLKKGIKTVCISEGIADTYKSFSVPEKQLLVAHDGIDDSFFGERETMLAARRRLGVSTDKKIVMYIGGFYGWKGLEMLLESSRGISEVQVVVIGGFPEEVVVYKNLYPDVIFLGSRPYSELKNNQQAADILIIPNSARVRVSSHYTSPLKLFAHMASGIPLVVSKVPSITSVVPTEEANYFTPDSSESLVKTIHTVLANKQESHDKADKLYLRAEKYTWNNRARQILNFIQN
jgi:glycosyltransferase involved in cell wall biosynthesis